jgi:homocitrate synthase
MQFSFSNYEPRQLEIIDTTLREGQQSSLLHDHHKYFFNTTDKMEIARALILYGVKFIELFAPTVSQQEQNDFKEIKQTRDELITQKGYTFLLAHVRCHPDDVSAAIKAGADGLNMYIGTSDQSIAHKHGMGIAQITRKARDLIEQVKQSHPHLILRFSGEDAFRTREPELFHVYDEIAPLVHRFGTPDTVGVATPDIVARRVKVLRERYPHIELEGHFHDDRGYATINALTAMRNGMRYIQTTLLGIGERSGITSMTGLLFNVFVDKEYDRLDGYQLRGSYPINVLMADKMRNLVPSKEPVSLTNRTHAAGVHQKAVINDAGTYEAHSLDQFGVTETEVLLGPLSGWNVIHYFLHEICGYDIDDATAKAVTGVFKKKVYQAPLGTSPSQVLINIAESEFGLKSISVPEEFRGAIVQTMTETSLNLNEPMNDEIGVTRHGTGIILRSKR